MCQRCDRTRAGARDHFKTQTGREPNEDDASLGDIQIYIAIVRERLDVLHILFPGGPGAIPPCVLEDIESHMLSAAEAAATLRRRTMERQAAARA
jgi:hypothetical protein